MSSIPTEQADLVIRRWADAAVGAASTKLEIQHGPRPFPMHGAPATGAGLVSNGAIGADIIRLPPGGGFPPHTHPGHHVLVVLAGRGTITYAGRVYPANAGEAYLVEGSVSHAVGAITEHVILAVGAPHHAVDSAARMQIVGYEEVLSDIGDLRCLICDIASEQPKMLHDVNCPHCPCSDCSAKGHA